MAPKRGREVATSAPTCRNVRNWWIPPLSAGETPCRSVGPGWPKQFSREQPLPIGRGCPNEIPQGRSGASLNLKRSASSCLSTGNCTQNPLRGRSSRGSTRYFGCPVWATGSFFLPRAG
eukprot:scaffold25756_cov66-Phaeocystis_antarctica.AAC.5